MKVKKVLRYYSECGRGFWKKQQSLSHDINCTCWKNPKFKTCKSCKFENIVDDSNGMESDPQFLETFQTNMCGHCDFGIAVHKDIDFIRKNCPKWESTK